MKLKKLSWLFTALLFVATNAFSLCQITGSASYSTFSSCSNSNITVSGNAILKKQDTEGQYVACGGYVKVELQKLIGSTWTTQTFVNTNTGAYSLSVLTSYGNGSYRIYISNPSSSCSCSSATTPWNSSPVTLSFNATSHSNSYSFNGVSTFNTGCYNFQFCEGQAISMDNIVMTNQSSNPNANTWSIGTSNDGLTFVWTTTVTGAPPSSYDLLSLLQSTYGTPVPPGSYQTVLKTYNGCSYYSNSYACLSILEAPTFVVGQKYDGTNFNTMPNNTACSSPYNNICPAFPYAAILTAENTISAITNCTWSCQLDEYALKTCVGTPTLVFSKPSTSIGSMSTLNNIDLNSYATTYGSKPSNYVSTNAYTKKWKFTLNIEYGCGNVYTYTAWLKYETAGCRLMHNEPVDSENGSGTIDENSLSVYPNPTTSKFEIKTDQIITSALLFDITGKQINLDIENNTMNLSGLKAGIYTLKVVTENGTAIRKIVKQE